jgi:hypothetical protein
MKTTVKTDVWEVCSTHGIRKRQADPARGLSLVELSVSEFSMGWKL